MDAEDDDLGLRVLLEESFGRFDAVEMGHFDVQKVHIDRAFLGDLQDVFAVDRLIDDRDVFLALLDDRPEAGPDDGVTIRQNDPDAHDKLPPLAA